VGRMPEWSIGADCKSAGLTPYEGSNPSPTTRVIKDLRKFLTKLDENWTFGAQYGAAEHQPCPSKALLRPQGLGCREGVSGRGMGWLAALLVYPGRFSSAQGVQGRR